MKKYHLIVVASLLAVGVIGFFALGAETNGKKVSTQERIEVTIYKSPTCGCCSVYASYMKREGYAVLIEDVEDLLQVKSELGVPRELESCHTTEVGGYVVEGHIPEEVIQKLLSEQPDIKGIGMPGMPAGSPGMPGPKVEDFVIYEITHTGSVGDIFATI